MSDDNPLAKLSLVDDATLRSLQLRLADQARADDLLDVAYRIVESPLGRLLLAATPRGLVRVAFESENHDTVLTRLAEQVSPRVLESPARLDEATTELDEFFAGRRRTFDLALDLQFARSAFRRAVIEQLPRIAYGSTASYTDVAAAVGKPRAIRAVGSACANNPLPLVVPCHRVVRTDGTIGNYLGGTTAKHYLLDLEAG